MTELGAQLIPAKPQNPISVVELGKKLLLAAKIGDTDQVRELMSKGAPFTTDWLGTSPLHFAALNSHLETCEVIFAIPTQKEQSNTIPKILEIL